MSVVVGPGSTFAGYRVESLVARGGMGVVYLATDLSLQRPVALKLIAPEYAGDVRFRERFLQEPRLAASLDHPHVIPIYEAGECEGHLYLAMRYVHGSDLSSLLERDERIAPERALRIVDQVAGALDAAHRRGLVHRDVKPANVLLDEEDEHAYLTDFGITKRLDGAAVDAGSAEGTIDYLAPEQIRGEPVDGRTDAYALACVLYECLTGSPPFRRRTHAQTLWAHLQEEPPSLPGYPALDPVLRRALAQDKDARYATCGELVDAARRALGLDAAARRRRRRALLAAGLILAAGTAAAAVVALRPGPEPAVAAPAGNGVAAIDPGGGRFAAFVGTAAAPSNIAVGDGAVWLADGEQQTLSRVDPETKKVTMTHTVPGVPTDLAAGDGAVWLGTGAGYGGNWTTSVSRIDPRTGATTYLAVLPRSARGGSILYQNVGLPQIAVGAGAVWATGGGAVARLDPLTGRLAATVAADASRLAAGDAGVWFLSGYDARVVTRIDPRTNRPAQRIRIGDSVLSGIAVGAGSVWVSSEQDGVVWRISPGSTPEPIEVGSGVTYVAYGDGALWTGNYVDGTVSRIDPTTNRVVGKVPIGAVQALAAGAGSAWASTAGATQPGTLPSPACGKLASAVPDPDVLVASELSLQGAGNVVSQSMERAIRTVLTRHGFRAGRYTVGYRSCDDSTLPAGSYEARRCAANANAYAHAQRLVAVIGPYRSGCAMAEIPILNRAPGGPLAMISPTNTAVGLTRPAHMPFGYRGEPEVYYPIGTRNYMRLASPESLEGTAHAVLAKRLGLRRVAVLDDGGGYWSGVLGEPFRKMAPRLGVHVSASVTFDPDARRYAGVVKRAADSGAQGVVLGGSPSDAGTFRLLEALRARLGSRFPIMAGGEFAGLMPGDLRRRTRGAARGLYVATLDVPRTDLPLTKEARRAVRGIGLRGPGVLEAAQATELVLQAIARGDGTRASVLERLRASRVEAGILGSFRFDRNGDISPGLMPIVRVTGRVNPDRGGPISTLNGAVVERVVKLPPSLAD
jgi:ABC-type branched-subunit amino acid transport system substrate-binding protein